MKTPLGLALSLALLPASAAAGVALDAKVEVTSAVAPGTGNVRLSGTPGAVYMLFFSVEEELTSIGGGIILFIDPFRAIDYGLHIEGTLDATGHANHSFPTGAEWIGQRISFQAVTMDTALHISNLCRATFQASNTFAEAVGLPASFSILGDLFPTAGGDLIAIGGAGPIVQLYDTCTQQSAPSGLLTGGALPFATRTPLPDGTILLTGGISAGIGGGSLSITASDAAFLYDPATDTTTPTANAMSAPRAGASATLLGNGKVFVVGGISSFDLTDPVSLVNGLLNSTELYDPATKTFAPGPTILEAKAFHTATLLDDGRVLVAGGLGNLFGIPFVSTTGHLYTASTNSFATFPKLFTGPRFLHTATKLSDGRVMLAGGFTADLSGVLETGDISSIAFATISTTTIFNPAAPVGGAFANGPALGTSRALHTATRLADGRILVAAGLTGSIDIGSILAGDIVLPEALATSELFSGGAFSAGPAMKAARAGASAAVSPMDGRVVIFGGGPLLPELYQQ